MIELRVIIQDKSNGRTGIMAETHDFREPSRKELAVAEAIFLRVGELILKHGGVVREETQTAVRRKRVRPVTERECVYG